jgi:hypothetical protein
MHIAIYFKYACTLFPVLFISNFRIQRSHRRSSFNYNSLAIYLTVQPNRKMTLIIILLHSQVPFPARKTTVYPHRTSTSLLTQVPATRIPPPQQLSASNNLHLASATSPHLLAPLLMIKQQLIGYGICHH